jgi:hypothetical protein
MSNQANATQDCTAGLTPVPAAPWRIMAVSVLPNYRLAVTFRDGSNAVMDFSSALTTKDAGIYAALADPQIFEQARLELGVITWPNGADMDPAWAYAETRHQKSWSVPV